MNKFFCALVATVLLAFALPTQAQTISFSVGGIPVEFELSSRAHGVQDDADVIGRGAGIDDAISRFAQETGVDIRVITTTADNPQELAEAALARSEEPKDDIVWVFSFTEVEEAPVEEAEGSGEGSGEGLRASLAGFVSDRAESIGLIGPEMEFGAYGLAMGSRVSNFVDETRLTTLRSDAELISFDDAEVQIATITQDTITGASTYKPFNPMPIFFMVFVLLFIFCVLYPPFGSVLLEMLSWMTFFSIFSGDGGT